VNILVVTIQFSNVLII